MRVCHWFGLVHTIKSLIYQQGIALITIGGIIIWAIKLGSQVGQASFTTGTRWVWIGAGLGGQGLWGHMGINQSKRQ